MPGEEAASDKHTGTARSTLPASAYFYPEDFLRQASCHSSALSETLPIPSPVSP